MTKHYRWFTVASFRTARNAKKMLDALWAEMEERRKKEEVPHKEQIAGSYPFTWMQLVKFRIKGIKKSSAVYEPVEGQSEEVDTELKEILDSNWERFDAEAAYLRQNGKMSLEFDMYRIDYRFRRGFPNFFNYLMTANYFDATTNKWSYSNKHKVSRDEGILPPTVILFLANDERRKTFIRRLN